MQIPNAWLELPFHCFHQWGITWITHSVALRAFQYYTLRSIMEQVLIHAYQIFEKNFDKQQEPCSLSFRIRFNSLFVGFARRR
jgi:hypothetical protein